jgi:hypothetical protein
MQGNKVECRLSIHVGLVPWGFAARHPRLYAFACSAGGLVSGRVDLLKRPAYVDYCRQLLATD